MNRISFEKIVLEITDERTRQDKLHGETNRGLDDVYFYAILGEETNPCRRQCYPVAREIAQ